MIYRVVADNYTVEFGENDNILCLEAVVTQKNTSYPVQGLIKDNYSLIGVHYIGNNTIADGKIHINSEIMVEGGNPFTDKMDMGNTQSNLSQEVFIHGTGKVNWWATTLQLPTHQLNNYNLYAFITDYSTFSGKVIVRYFFKVH